MRRVYYVIQKAKERNDRGVYFPIIATCLGFEGLLISENLLNTKTLDCNMKDHSQAHSIALIKENFQKSKYWSQFKFDEISRLFKGKVLYFSHSCGLRVNHFKENKLLSASFRLIATSRVDNDYNIVTSIEHKKYPFLANQWHPEKNQYERSELYATMNKSSELLRILQEMPMKMFEPIKKKEGKPDSQFIRLTKKYYAMNLDPDVLPVLSYERVYGFPRLINNIAIPKETQKDL